MRVLFTTTGNPGHLLPLVPIAHACVRRGHDVRVATQRSRGDGVRAAGLALHAVDDPPPGSWEPIMAASAGRSVEETNALVVREVFGRIDTRAALPGLLDLVATWRPDVIVRESYEFAGALAAELHGIPHVRVGLGLALTEHWAVGLARPALADVRAELGLVDDPDAARILTSPYLTSVPGALEDPGEPGPLDAFRFRATVPGTAAPLPDWWRGDDRPLVYVTFGSMAGDLGYFPHLYRAVIDALATVPARVLVTTGRGDPAELVDRPPGVHVERWVAQDEVLPHADVVVGHGGFGTTLGALAHGVPVVMLPLFASDQWQLAERVTAVGAGVTLPERPEPGRRTHDGPGAAAIASLPDAVRRLLDQPAHRRVARTIADAIAGLAPVDAAVDVLERTASAGAPSGARVDMVARSNHLVAESNHGR